MACVSRKARVGRQEHGTLPGPDSTTTSPRPAHTSGSTDVPCRGCERWRASPVNCRSSQRGHRLGKAAGEPNRACRRPRTRSSPSPMERVVRGRPVCACSSASGSWRRAEARPESSPAQWRRDPLVLLVPHAVGEGTRFAGRGEGRPVSRRSPSDGAGRSRRLTGSRPRRRGIRAPVR